MNQTSSIPYQTCFASITSAPVLPQREIAELFKRYKAGDEDAGTKIIESNILLVFATIRRKFMFALRDGKIEFADLVSEGVIGLHKALEKYDPARTRFTTYAVYWIRQTIQRSLETYKYAIRTPEELLEMRRHARHYHAAQEWKDEPTPDLETTAQYLGVPTTQLAVALKLPVVHYVLDSPCHQRAGEQSEDVFSDFLVADGCTEEEAIDLVDRALIRTKLEVAMQVLTERERFVICHRMGFVNEPLSLEKIAKTFNVSRETIRQNERRAHEKLKREMVRQGFEC